jgi:hypothetical protein
MRHTRMNHFCLRHGRTIRTQKQTCIERTPTHIGNHVATRNDKKQGKELGHLGSTCWTMNSVRLRRWMSNGVDEQEEEALTDREAVWGS